MNSTWINLLPKKTLGVVFQYNPTLVVTCFYLPQKIEILLDRQIEKDNFFEDNCINCPFFIENKGECEGGVDKVDRDECRIKTKEDLNKVNIQKIKTPFYLFRSALDFEGTCIPSNVSLLIYNFEKLRETGELNTLTYKLPNIYDSGAVCWGHIFRHEKRLLDFKTLVNTFWATPFNSDLLPSGIEDVYEWMKDLTPTKLLDFDPFIQWKDSTKSIKGKFSLSIAGEVEGVFFSKDPQVVNLFKKQRKLKLNRYVPAQKVVIGWLHKGKYRLDNQIMEGLYVQVDKEYRVYNKEHNRVEERVKPAK